MKIAVLGTGSWGTALAKVLRENNHEVIMWGRDESEVNEINQEHRNHKYLPGISLPEELTATTSLEKAVETAKMVALVLPSKAIREVSQKLEKVLADSGHRPILVHGAKGLEQETKLRMSQVIESEINEEHYEALVVLSGPSHAEEVAKRDVTTITAASYSLSAAEAVQEAFMNNYFRVYTNKDVIGVELGGALKNIIAVCAGMLAGLNYGDNAKAALITRGLAEISRLGTKMGADPLTFSGLSGIGDLIVTCTSKHSRNFQAGSLLAQGFSASEVEVKVAMVIEGFNTCQVAYQIAQEMNVEIPITEMLYRALYSEEKLAIADGIKQLMMRQGKQEASLNQNIQ